MFPPWFLGDQTPLGAVVIPKSAQNFAGHHLPHVHSDQSNDEHPIATQIVLSELGQYAGFSLRRVERSKLFPHVLDLPGPVERLEEPLEEVSQTDCGQTDEPEPDEQKDLLVEQVYGQRTLDDVAVKTGLGADLELTQSDPGEPLRFGPIETAQESLDDESTVQVVVVYQQRVQQEELTDGVDDVDGLDGQIGRDEVVTVQTTAYDAADFCDEVFDADATSGSVVALS